MIIPSNAVSTYDPNVALAFAGKHWSDGIGLCAEFVSRCLNAGGCESFNKSCTLLVDILRKRTDCKEYTIPVNPDRTVSIRDHQNKIAPGDPLFFHCSYQKNYQHAALCNGMDKNGLLKVYAHNPANDGSRAIRYGYFCPECGQQSIDYITVFHFEPTPPELTAWMSDREEGSRTDQFLTGEQYYLCYALREEGSGRLYDSYGSRDYKVSVEVYQPDNSLLCAYTYRNDRNWLSVRFPEAGRYRYRVTVNGEFSDAVTGSFEVKACPMTLTAESVQEKLSLDKQPSKTVALRVAGFHADPFSVKLSETTDGAFSAALDSFDRSAVKLTISARAVGQGSVTVSLFDALTSEKLATETINITVTGTEATVFYHGNGGTEAPPSQRAFRGEGVLLTTREPKGKAFPVRFDANGGESFASEKRYVQSFRAWNTEPDGTGTSYLGGEYCRVNAPMTLYAQYDRCFLGDEVAGKDGWRFLGWYDSPEYDSYGAPIGTYYAPGTEITRELTLYAMWSASEDLLFGDLNFDGVIAETDRMKMLACMDGESEADQLSAFLGDLDADGDVDQDDASLLEDLLGGTIPQEALPAHQAQKQILVEGGLRTEPSYGKRLDPDGLALRIAYAEDIVYSLTDQLTVTGFDPYRIGEQTLTVSFGQFSAEYPITVPAPEYLLTLDAGAGNVPNRQLRVTYGRAIGELPLPVRAGYTFLGWSFDGLGTQYISKETVYSASESRTAYACWKSGCSESSHAYEAVITAPTCTQAGYTEYTCTVCGDSHREQEGVPLDHRFAEGYCFLCGQADRSYIHGMCDGAVNCPSAVFADRLKPSHWAHAGIDFCIANGLLVGDSATTFSPDRTMTRAMLVTVLYRMEGKPAITAANPFADVKADTWYTDAVIWAAENGIVNGMEPNRFCPNHDITREQIATIFYRYASYKSYDTVYSENLKDYPDADRVSRWAYDALCWATDAGLINGIGRQGGSYLAPRESAARAQAAVILTRFINHVS